MMEYKGYTGRITSLEEEQSIFHGQVEGITDVITFEGKSAEEVAKAFRESVDDYLEFCKARDEAPDKPYSGRFVVRVSPELHRKASSAAKRAGQSLNTLITSALREYLEQTTVGRPQVAETASAGRDALEWWLAYQELLKCQTGSETPEWASRHVAIAASLELLRSRGLISIPALPPEETDYMMAFTHSPRLLRDTFSRLERETLRAHDAGAVRESLLSKVRNSISSYYEKMTGGRGYNPSALGNPSTAILEKASTGEQLLILLGGILAFIDSVPSKTAGSTEAAKTEGAKIP
jgi:predicted HicB family RNase H-like nuclease